MPKNFIEVRKLAELKPDPQNARRHSAAQIDQIAKSIETFGMVETLVIRPDGQLIGGEGRWRAMQKLGTIEAECRVVHGLTAAQYTALALALNRIGENSEWDDNALAAAIGQIRTAGDDAGVAGFGDREIAALLNEAPAWPADKPRRRAVDALLPNAKNSRTHSPAQIDQIAASIREFGFTNPILIDPDGGIIAGHGRVLAAKKLGIIDLPVMIAKGWTDAQKRAYLIADNKLAENAGWDEALLAAEFAALREAGFDLDLTGFGAAEIAAMNGTLPDSSKLADRFGIPPFSVFNAREGWWQDRKAAWLALGIQSEVGRGDNLMGYSDTAQLDGNRFDAARRGMSKVTMSATIERLKPSANQAKKRAKARA